MSRLACVVCWFWPQFLTASVKTPWPQNWHTDRGYIISLELRVKRTVSRAAAHPCCLVTVWMRNKLPWLFVTTADKSCAYLFQTDMMIFKNISATPKEQRPIYNNRGESLLTKQKWTAKEKLAHLKTERICSVGDYASLNWLPSLVLPLHAPYFS